VNSIGNSEIPSKEISVTDPVAFLVEVVIVSLSGALAPGPLTASTATLGAQRGWRAGLLVSIGHMIVEVPLVIAISFGVLAAFTSSPEASLILGLVGGIFLVFFGLMTSRDAVHAELPKSAETRSLKAYSTPLSVGMSLSVFNPYFIIWWLGVGAPLIVEAISIGGFSMLAVFYVSHVWLDFVWLILVASISSLSKLNAKYYRVILAALSVMVFLFGVNLILRVSVGISIMPF
jgi:threonine/homoserine/homoserine lactone efflux protein